MTSMDTDVIERTTPDTPSEEPGILSRLATWQRFTLLAALMFVAGAVGFNLGHPGRPGAGSPEVGFLQDMILHHEQAVTMALLTVDDAEDDEIHIFAEEIVAAQQYEIGLMEGYLRRWDYPRQSDRTVSMAWAGTPHTKDAMPGMASEAELAAVKDAEGGELHEQFTRLMIAHHAGGVAMAEAALDRIDDEDIQLLAERIISAQRSEIAEMHRTRQRLGLPPAPTEAEHHTG